MNAEALLVAFLPGQWSILAWLLAVTKSKSPSR